MTVSREMPAGLLTSREAQQAGRVIYKANCAICQGVIGDGRGQRQEGMNPRCYPQWGPWYSHTVIAVAQRSTTLGRGCLHLFAQESLNHYWKN